MGKKKDGLVKQKSKQKGKHPSDGSSKAGALKSSTGLSSTEGAVAEDEPPTVGPGEIDELSSLWPSVTLLDPNRFFFVPNSSSIQIFSAESLELASTLSSVGGSDRHTETVTVILINPHNPLQLYSASLDGTIKIWDWLEGTVLRTIEYEEAVLGLCVHESKPDVFFVASLLNNPAMKTVKGVEQPSKSTCRISSVTFASNALITGDKTIKPKKKLKIGTTRPITGMAMSPDGQWLIALAGTKAHIAETASPKKGFVKFVAPEKPDLLCLAVHPTQNVFATGDDHGNILVWHCLSEEHIIFEKLHAEKRPATRMLKWHAHPVSSLAFTNNGSYLVSGGVEATLVLWHVDTGKKGFLPRVGAPIQSVATSETQERGQEILLDLVDGTFLVHNAVQNGFRLRSATVKLCTPAANGYHPFLAIDTQNSLIALPSYHPSSLQICSPYSPSSIIELEVFPSNRVTHPDKPTIIAPATVIHTAFDSSSTWFATIDEGNITLDSTFKVHLKIWQFDEENYSLHTRFDMPHGHDRVVDLAFSRRDALLATAGEDGNVKLWSNKQRETGTVWSSKSTLRFRDEAPVNISFSPDGTILAVAYERCVVLWNTRTHALARTIRDLPFKTVRSVTFVGATGRHIAICGPETVGMWDLVRNQLTQQICSPGSIPEVQRNPSFFKVLPIADTTAYLVLASDDRHTSVRMRETERPGDIRSQTIPHGIACAEIIPSAGPLGFTLILLTIEGKLALLGDVTEIPSPEGTAECSLPENSIERLSLFEDVFGRSAFKDLEAPVDPQPLLRVNESFGAALDLRLLEGPAYLMPPMETLYTDLMSGLLLRPNSEEVVDENDREMDVDIPTPASPAPAAPRVIRRQVGESEISLFVDLFKQQAIFGLEPGSSETSQIFNGNGKGLHERSLSETSGRSKSIPNGTHVPNGHPKPRKPHKSKGKEKSLDKDKVMQQPSPPPTPISPLLNGSSISMKSDSTTSTATLKPSTKKRKAPPEKSG